MRVVGESLLQANGLSFVANAPMLITYAKFWWATRFTHIS